MRAGWIRGAAAAALFCGLAACGPQKMEIGVRDDAQTSQIERINSLRRHLDRHDYKAAETVLTVALAEGGSAFRRQHVLNELADLYSFYLLDPEAALETDAEIVRLGRMADDPSYRTLNSIANNRVLVDPDYRSKYIDISTDAILEAAARRTDRNRKLLSGELPSTGKSYDAAFLQSYVRDVSDDLGRTVSGTPDRRRLVSRLIRAEFELARATGNATGITDGFRQARQEGMSRGDFFFDEIDFISLSRYYEQAYRIHKDIALMEMSLHVIYLPYTNLRDSESRWRYNKLINDSINVLIRASYQSRDDEGTLYYVTLNKSRMVLEEKVRLRGGNLSSAAAGGLPVDRETGMPDRGHFRDRLSKTQALLDFYIEGGYHTVPADSEAARAALRDATGSPADLRGLAVVAGGTGQGSGAEVLEDRFALVSLISNGQVRMHALDAPRLARVKSALDSELLEIAGRRKPAADGPSAAARAAMRDLVPFEVEADTPVSPDKWLARHPMSHLLGLNDHRVLNLLTLGTADRLSEIRLTGYFNPTSDLPDADAEMAPIRSVIPDARMFSRDQATLEQLRRDLPRNILHLSMHGYYQARQPARSKLLLAGSRLDKSLDDPRALYAADMIAMPQFQNNDLVFTAACQTGLLGSDGQNHNEILGIMRPLLINNNRNIILTLWNVNSRTAGEFVQEFYRNLAFSRDIPRSFDAARTLLRNRYPDQPNLWAPYILVQNG